MFLGLPNTLSSPAPRQPANESTSSTTLDNTPYPYFSYTRALFFLYTEGDQRFGGRDFKAFL